MNHVHRTGGSRFRLRFLLQEFELQPGETLIGRSDDCEITIFDPLISRQHARILVSEMRAVLEDLGSRNGCRVNGARIQEPTVLREGARIRLGKHELVFTEVPVSSGLLGAGQTGSLVYCASCDMAYPGELGSCPSCGSRQALDENTRSGVFSDVERQGWALDMVVELCKKGLASNRSEEAERSLRQAVAMLESQLKTFYAVDPQRLDQVSRIALQLSSVQKTSFWPNWVLDFYERAGLRPSDAVAAEAARWLDDRSASHGPALAVAATRSSRSP
jgi:hypothetical protein